MSSTHRVWKLVAQRFFRVNDASKLRRQRATGSLLDYSPFQGGWAGKAYNEHAFRHFLSIERSRANQSACWFLLVLVSLKRPPGSDIDLAPSISAALFSGLGLCVREVDFVGWFREDRVAGAVLAQGKKPTVEVTRIVRKRITEVLCNHLPLLLRQRLQVRVVQLGSRTTTG